MLRRYRTWGLRAVAVAGVTLGIVLIWRSLGRFSAEDILRSTQNTSVDTLVLCMVFALASFACLTLNDWVALRYVGHPLPYRRAALASFVSLSLGHSIGFGGISSGAIRYRFYSRWGLSFADVAQLVVFSGATVAMGLLSVAAMMLIVFPGLTGAYLNLPPPTCHLIGGAFAVVVAAYYCSSLLRIAEIRVRGRVLKLPRPAFAAAQIAIGTLDVGLVAACLYSALRAESKLHYTQVVAAYVASNAAGLVAHVPGGLGVIETAVLHILPGNAGKMVGALIIFRLTYYLIPLAVGIAALLVAESRFRRSDSR